MLDGGWSNSSFEQLNMAKIMIMHNDNDDDDNDDDADMADDALGAS